MLHIFPRLTPPIRLLMAGLTVIICIGCSPAATSESAFRQSGNATLRVATFNVSMGLPEPGDLGRVLKVQTNPRLQQLAEILQRVRPDIVLLSEFDYDPDLFSAALLNLNYLGVSQNGQRPLEYPYSLMPAVNTGVDSGLDLNGDGRTGDPADAWGFGTFPGQYGMLVLSRFPINAEATRTWQYFLWSGLPAARRPENPDGTDYYADSTWRQLRLSSKNHIDVLIDSPFGDFHLLAFHPTPPVFDGPENRNGRRNYDEIRFWSEFLSATSPNRPADDEGNARGLSDGTRFVIAGDFNADPQDGDSMPGAAAQLLDHPRIDSRCIPTSEGAEIASREQAGVNLTQRGDPAADTADFNDDRSGNLRADYLLPSDNLRVAGCGVFWPAPGQPGAELVEMSDHRLVWLDIGPKPSSSGADADTGR